LFPVQLQSHHEPQAIKTDAPAEAVWDVMRSYCQVRVLCVCLCVFCGESWSHVFCLQRFPPAITTAAASSSSSGKGKGKNVAPSAHAILARPVTRAVDFTVPAALRGPRKKAARWAPNPEDNWGPKRRAGRVVDVGEGGECEGEEEDEEGQQTKRMKS